MAISIVSGAGSDQLTVDATSKAGRVTLYNIDGSVLSEQATYRAIDKAATTVGSATSPFLVLQGSGTKTIKIIRVRFSSTAATGTVADFWLSKFTTISGGTTRTAPTIAKADSNDGNATAVVSAYSTVPSTATQADGFWSSIRYEVVTAAVTVLPELVDLEYGTNFYSRALTLRGTGQYFGIGISAAGTTPVSDTMIEWIEY